MPEILSVVIAEDNYLVREGPRQLLEAGGDIQVLAAVGSTGELLDAVARLRPDAVLTDIRVPPGHHIEGIEAALEVRSQYPTIGVVVLSQHADDSYAMALLKEGTAGLASLLKERIGDRGEPVRALSETKAGRSVIDPVVEALVSRSSRATESKLRDLTSREREVLSLMAQGKTNLGIAESLRLSNSAVEKHINNIFSKLGLSQESQIHRRVAAVLAFLQERTPSRQ